MIKFLEILENTIDFINIILEILTIVLCFAFIFNNNINYLAYIGVSLVVILSLSEIRTIIIKKVIEML